MCDISQSGPAGASLFHLFPRTFKVSCSILVSARGTGAYNTEVLPLRDSCWALTQGLISHLLYGLQDAPRHCIRNSRAVQMVRDNVRAIMDSFVSPISIYFLFFFPKLRVLESVVMTTEEWTWLTSAAFVPSKWADLKFVKTLLSPAAKNIVSISREELLLQVSLRCI